MTQACPTLFMSNCHIVGNHMSRLNYIKIFHIQSLTMDRVGGLCDFAQISYFEHFLQSCNSKIELQ